jgi:hypothetical protein
VRAGSHRHFVRGRGAEPEEGDLVVQATKKHKLRAHDLHLKNFQYKVRGSGGL